MPALPPLDRLKSVLRQSGIQQTNQPLFQVIDQLINWARDAQVELNAQVQASAASVEDGTFLTTGNDIVTLPNSKQLLAGIGITFDDSVFGQRTINASGSLDSGFWTPLTDGDEDETDLIFASGECIMVFVPTP